MQRSVQSEFGPNPLNVERGFGASRVHARTCARTQRTPTQKSGPRIAPRRVLIVQVEILGCSPRDPKISI